MDLRDSPQEATFRDRLRAWLSENLPPPLPAYADAAHDALTDWHKALYRGGWVGLSWPVEYGGQGLGPLEEAIFLDELGRAGAPQAPAIGYIGRAIMVHGTDEQKRRYLAPLLASDEMWCQGFSEPDAGSDLASLRTRAVLDGDHFVINGSKIWTSRAKFADFCLLLARTDPDVAKHAGISAIIVDMRTPGITVSPIEEITRNKDHFCQVFFDDVHVPASNLIGELNSGWTIAQTTMAYERGPADIGVHAPMAVLLARSAQSARERGLDGDVVVRRKLAHAAVALEVLRLRGLQALTARKRGAAPGPTGSVDKLLWSQTEQLVGRAAIDVLGVDASLGERDIYNRYLRSRAATILGGTAQIQRTILATRVLGLPNERGRVSQG